MLVPVLILTAIMAATAVHGLVVGRRPAWQRRQLEQMSLKAQLPIEDADGVPVLLRARLGERLARRELGAGVGGLVGALPALAALLVVPDARLLSGPYSYAPLLLVGLGAAAGSASTAARDALELPCLPGPRRARSRAIRLEDHVPRLPLACGRLLCAVPVAAVVVVVVCSAVLGEPVAAQGGTSLAALVHVALVAAAWVSAEVLARRLVALPQPAGRPVELAWDDVLRTGEIRQLAVLPTYLGGVAFVVLPDLLAETTGTAGATDIWWTGCLLVGGALMAGILGPGLGRPPERYVRARLWPVVPATGRPGEVDDPALAP